jgi:hypothetical protein
MTTMTAAERNALLKMIARNARVAAADVDSLAAERYADFERQATKIWEAQDLGIKQLIDDANAQIAPVIAQIRQLITDRCDEMGVLAELRPCVGDVRFHQPWVLKDRKAELRRTTKADIDAARKRAKVEIERSRSQIEARVLTSAITSDEGRAILEQLPSADALLPPVDVQAILSAKADVT